LQEVNITNNYVVMWLSHESVTYSSSSLTNIAWLWGVMLLAVSRRWLDRSVPEV